MDAGPAFVRYGNEVEIRSFLERSLDIVIGIEFIKMLAKHSPGSSLEVLLYAIARHLVVGHDSALENLLSVGAIALIFIVRKFFFVPAFGAHLPDGHPAPDLFSKAERHPGRGVHLPSERPRQGRGGRGHSFRRRDFLTSTILSRPPRNQNNINKYAPQHCRKTSRLRGIFNFFVFLLCFPKRYSLPLTDALDVGAVHIDHHAGHKPEPMAHTSISPAA